MKKWSKFSLGSLMVPTAITSIVFVASGCNHPTNVNVAEQPKYLIAKPKFLASDKLFASSTMFSDAQTWWNTSIGNDVSKQVEQVNKWFEKSTSLKLEAVKLIEFHLVDQLTNKFTIVITLNDQYHFQDHTPSPWHPTETISYLKAKSVKTPILFSDAIRRKIIGEEKTLDDWLIKNNTLQLKLNAINEVIENGQKLSPNEVSSIDFIPVNVGSKEFTISITLTQDYLFVDDNNQEIGLTWNSSKDQTIWFATMIDYPQTKENCNASGSQPTAQAWWENLTKDEQFKKVNEWLVTPLPLTVNEIKAFEYSPSMDTNVFNIQIILGDGFVFSDGADAAFTMDIRYNA